jgi:large repetitive protein
VLTALALVLLPVELGAIPAAGAVTADIRCSSFTFKATLSPALPVVGDPTTVTPTVTATATFSGCVGLGITGGTVTYSGAVTSPVNCNGFSHENVVGVGTSTISWSNGQSSTISNGFPFLSGSALTSGLFAGGYFEYGPGSFVTGNPGWCTSSPMDTYLWSGPSLLFHLPAPGPTSCASTHPCDTTRNAPSSATAPGLAVTVTGAPATASGTVTLTIASGVLTCPRVTPSVRPVANLTDTGFAPTDRLNVTATLPLASSTSAEQVCFHSTVPFKSQSNPITKKAGTALLLNCTQVANVAPCVTSSKQVGSNVVVTFVVPGADPNFTIVPPTGREMWASTLGLGTVGNTYSAHFTTKGGRAPFSWSVASGSLPPGCKINPASGTITGKPTAKGTYTAVIQATDSEKPRKTARLSVPFTIR